MIAVIAVVFYLLDQATKFLVLKTISFGTSIPIIPNFFYLVHVRNTGAAFGIFQDNNRVFIGLSLVAMIILILFLKTFRSAANRWGAGLLLGGIAGNLTDRLLHGSVIDFLDFILPLYGHWPAFNVADSCICVAGMIFIYSSLFESKPRAS